MSEKEWWHSYGSFKRWSQCPSRPDPGEVLLFFLEKRGIRPEEYVSFLCNLLELQKSMVYNVLKGEGFDSISRCRILVKALKIHPPLLGIDAKFYPIERHACWWHSYGFSFHADAQGYPLMSEVVAYLRTQRTQRIEDGKVKVWSQEDLGDATGLKKETIYRAEHEKNPLILESMSRRAIMASALSTLSGEKEPTIFRLFGLDPQAYRVPVPAQDIVPEVHFLPAKLTDETLLGYQQEQATFFQEYFTCHAQNTVEEAHEWLRRGATLLPRAKTTAQRVHLLALQSHYHQLLAGVAREQRRTNVIMYHTDKAVGLAEQAMRLPDPKSGHQELLVVTNELFAVALLRRADAYYEGDRYELAQTDIDHALSLLPHLQSSQLKAHIVADAGLIHASTAVSEMDRTLVSSYLSLAAQINTPSQGQQASDTRDDHFIRCGTDMLYLRKAMALCSPHMKDATAEQVWDILELAQRFVDPALIRRQTILEVLQAQTYLQAHDYQTATEFALSALEKSRQIRSRLNRGRIAKLYQHLLSTAYRDKPLLSYLGVKLRTWDHGLG